MKPLMAKALKGPVMKPLMAKAPKGLIALKSIIRPSGALAPRAS